MHVLAVLAAAVLFGTTGTSQALGPDGTTPLSIGVMRMVIGGTGLALIAFLLAARHARRRPAGAVRPRAGIRPLSLMVLTGACLEYEVCLSLKPEHVRGVKLDKDGGARLGFDSFVCSRPPQHPRSDTRYGIHTLQ